MPPPTTVRPIREEEIDAADRIFRLAFGTFLGLAQPETFGGDSSCIRTRSRSPGVVTLVAVRGGEVVGSNVVTCWGTVGFFGPLSVRPDLWDQGVAHALLGPTLALFEERGVTLRGLYTFSQSAKHVRLYQGFGFWPRFLNITLSTAPALRTSVVETFASENADSMLTQIRSVAGSNYLGFDPTPEACAVRDQRLGETVLLRSGSTLVGFAICHLGAGSEAGSGGATIKVACVRPGPEARAWFNQLLDAVESMAHRHGAERVRAGVHSSRIEAYRTLLDRGWQTEMQGVAMFSPADGGGYDRSDAWVIEDWR